jgi:hypothetical protein
MEQTTSSLTRVSMNFNKRSLDNVEVISKLLPEGNKTRVVSIALELTRTILEMRDKGDKILTEDSKGQIREMKLII